jgi:hypothetical protein
MSRLIAPNVLTAGEYGGIDFTLIGNLCGSPVMVSDMYSVVPQLQPNACLLVWVGYVYNVFYEIN